MTNRMSSALDVRGDAVHCGKCGHDLGSAAQGWKPNAIVRERPMNNAGGAPYKSREHVLLRSFVCPGCGRLLATETAMKDDPFLNDVLGVG
jgi:acetone carboxylase gamma subunit